MLSVLHLAHTRRCPSLARREDQWLLKSIAYRRNGRQEVMNGKAEPTKGNQPDTSMRVSLPPEREPDPKMREWLPQRASDEI